MLLKKAPLMVIALCCAVNILFAKDPIKYGKVSEEELKMTVYEADTAAEAVILCDFGLTYFEFTHLGFGVVTTYVQRIKILKPEGLDLANFSISLYNGNEVVQQITKFRACTYNLQEDGKVEEVKLSLSDAYKEQLSRVRERRKFAFEGVKVGSVIEFEYTITSNLWSIPDWSFQSSIPTVHSEYQVRIPEYFTFKQLETGYFSLTSRNIETRTRTEGDLTFNEEYQTLIAKDVPAFREEPFTDCPENYMTSMKYELSRFIPPYGTIKNYSATWESINKQLNNDEDFGKRLDDASVIKNEIELLKATCTTPEEQMAAVYNLVQNRMIWNKSNTVFATKSKTKFLEEGSGSSGDINLFLTSALKRIGLLANPVILSTRDNGMIHPAIALIDQFNYVIASVKIGEKLYLLDATDKYAIPGMLPQRCLNEKGRLINETGGEWINLAYNTSYDKTIQVNLAISPDGTATGTLVEKHDGYSALEFRNKLSYFNNPQEYTIDYQKEYSGVTLELDSITGTQSKGKSVIASYKTEIEGAAELAGNLLLLKPVFFHNIEENPLKLEERKYPVDFSYPKNMTYVGTYELPAGYEPEAMPQPQRIVLPEKAGSLVINYQKLNNKISVIVRVNFAKAKYYSTEYPQLKEFYNLIIEAENKPIVIKKV